MYSSVPNALGSMLCQASSRTTGLAAAGPTPSIQWYPEAKFPPGYLIAVKRRRFIAARTSERYPWASACRLPGSYTPS